MKTKGCFLVWLKLCLAAVVALSLPVSVTAEEQQPIVCEGEEMSYGADGKVIEGRGSVSVSSGDAKLTCDRITFYTETREAFAEGNVVLTRPGSILKGEKVKYDFFTKQGTLTEGTFQTGPCYGGIESAEIRGEDKAVIHQGYATTCGLPHPHYQVKARRIIIYPGNLIVARNAVFYAGKIPLFYLPHYHQSLQGRGAGMSLIPGRNQDWGAYLLSAWRIQYEENQSTYLHLDYRELKGAAYGIDRVYDTEKWGKGAASVYYAGERNKEPDTGEPSAASRYRVQYRQHWQPDDDTRGYLEYYRAKDARVSKDYFYRDYEIDGQPPSRFSLIHNGAGPDYGLNLTVSKRTNRFFSEVEKLPSLEMDLMKREIGGGKFYYEGDVGLANLGRETADSSDGIDTARFDTEHRFSYTTRLPGVFSGIEFSPYLGARETFYERDLSGEDRDFFRGAFFGGSGLGTRYYRIYDRRGKILGTEIDRIKHIVTPQIEYDYVHRPTVDPSRLGGLDSVDTMDRENTFHLSLENKLQTRWLPAGGGTEKETVDLAYLRTYIDYSPRPESGTRSFSDLGMQMELKPRRWLRLYSDAAFDTYADQFKTVNVDVFAEPGGKWKAGVGHRYARDSHRELTTDFTYALNPLWKFRIFQRYEFEGDEENEQELCVSRDLHCWVGELTLNHGGPEHGDTVFFVMRLKAFPELPFSFRTSAHERPGR